MYFHHYCSVFSLSLINIMSVIWYTSYSCNRWAYLVFFSLKLTHDRTISVKCIGSNDQNIKRHRNININRLLHFFFFVIPPISCLSFLRSLKWIRKENCTFKATFWPFFIIVVALFGWNILVTLWATVCTFSLFCVAIVSLAAFALSFAYVSPAVFDFILKTRAIMINKHTKITITRIICLSNAKCSGMAHLTATAPVG